MSAVAETASLLQVRACRQLYHKDSSPDLLALEDVNLNIATGRLSDCLGAPAQENPRCCASPRACCGRLRAR
jgi:hypothetical protein